MAAGFSYDSDGLLTKVGSLNITRDPQTGLIIGTSRNNITSANSYSSFGEVSGYTAAYAGSALWTAAYTRDKLGRITSETETIGGATNTYTYGYDTAGRLTDAWKGGTLTGHYEYDSNSNRLSYTGISGAAGAAYDSQDRLLSYGNFTYTYTANGELLTKTATSTGQATAYSYDVLGNLTSATLPDGTTIEYVIDGRNRRVGKKINGTLGIIRNN